MALGVLAGYSIHKTDEKSNYWAQPASKTKQPRIMETAHFIEDPVFSIAYEKIESYSQIRDPLIIAREKREPSSSTV